MKVMRLLQTISCCSKPCINSLLVWMSNSMRSEIVLIKMTKDLLTCNQACASRKKTLLETTHFSSRCLWRRIKRFWWEDYNVTLRRDRDPRPARQRHQWPVRTESDTANRNTGSIKLTILPIQCKNNPDTYTEWETKVKLVFHCHKYLNEKMVELAVVAFTDYTIVWWVNWFLPGDETTNFQLAIAKIWKLCSLSYL